MGAISTLHLHPFRSGTTSGLCFARGTHKDAASSQLGKASHRHGFSLFVLRVTAADDKRVQDCSGDSPPRRSSAQNLVDDKQVQDSGCDTPVRRSSAQNLLDDERVQDSGSDSPLHRNSAQNLACSMKIAPKGADGVLRSEFEDPDAAVRHPELRVGRIYKGKVSLIESYGVFVDIGAHCDGFVHISRLGRSFVRRVEDVVQLGEDVSVQIVDLDLHTDAISLRLTPEEGFDEGVGLRPLTLSESEAMNRAAARRSNKLARRSGIPLSRRRMSLETRQRLKAYRRTVLAERQAIQLHQSRAKAGNVNGVKGASGVDEVDEVTKANC